MMIHYPVLLMRVYDYILQRTESVSDDIFLIFHESICCGS